MSEEAKVIISGFVALIFIGILLVLVILVNEQNLFERNMKCVESGHVWEEVNNNWVCK